MLWLPLLGVFPCSHQHVVMQWWDMISHSGFSNSALGNDIPRWVMKFHRWKWWYFLLDPPASTPIHKGIPPAAPAFVEAARGRLPHGWVARLGRQGGNPTIPHRRISFPIMEFHFPLWNIISQRGILNATIGYHIPPLHDQMLMTTWKHAQL